MKAKTTAKSISSGRKKSMFSPLALAPERSSLSSLM